MSGEPGAGARGRHIVVLPGDGIGPEVTEVAPGRLDDTIAELRGHVFALESEPLIRPILLVQVERTGAEQRDGSHIHALDVKDWLQTAEKQGQVFKLTKPIRFVFNASHQSKAASDKATG